MNYLLYASMRYRSQPAPSPAQAETFSKALPPPCPPIPPTRPRRGQLRSSGPPCWGLLQGFQQWACGFGAVVWLWCGAAMSRESQALSDVPGPSFCPVNHSVSERWACSSTKAGRGAGDWVYPAISCHQATPVTGAVPKYCHGTTEMAPLQLRCPPQACTAGCWRQGEIHKPKWFSHKNNEISNTHNQDQHRRWHTELSSSCHKMLSAAGTTHPLQRAPGWMRQLGMTSNAPRGTFAASSLGFGTSVPPSLSGCDGVEHFCLPYHGTRRCRWPRRTRWRGWVKAPLPLGSHLLVHQN